MYIRQRLRPTRGRVPLYAPPPPPDEVYNIIPIHTNVIDHPSLRIPEVRAASVALLIVDDLRRPPFSDWSPGAGADLLDWLAALFGFQADNVGNQREHLVLHLANAQMRLNPPPRNADALDPDVVRSFRKKLLRNYTLWCSYLGMRHKLLGLSTAFRVDVPTLRRELLYVALYLLIWGESANLRFMPECICYVFHHMADELNSFLEERIDRRTGRPNLPSFPGKNAFLKSVVMPIYRTIQTEVEGSRNGSAPHSAWRNYDDLNEYFWSRRCFKTLKWPMDLSCNYFATASKSKTVGKTGFVEQRSFWNVFRSFDRLWVLLILLLQAMVIIAWEETEYPWQALERRDVQVKLLTVFITWSGLRLLQSVLDAGMQYSLVSRETFFLGLRMVLKSLVAVTWIVEFSVFYARIWSQKNADGIWSREADRRIVVYLKTALVYVIPELLALALFTLPWIRIVIEESNWRILYLFTWWFHTRIFVGRGRREGLVNNIKYTLFWVLVLVSKISFSYLLQIKPLVAPTKSLLDLRGTPYKWPEFFGGTNRMAVILLWTPVILIYLMDLQIWYSIFSSLVGATIGLYSHLGEIRNIKQLRLRFQFFAGAIQFNLMPEKQILTAEATWFKKLHDAIQRLKLRYGIGQPYKMIESNSVDATRFALIWNEIITVLREEDLISDGEFELLELPPNCWNIRVIRWPCALLCNELLLALSQASGLAENSDRYLWFKICKNENRRCAVIEAYDSIKYLIITIIKDYTEEKSIVMKLFDCIDMHIQNGEITKLHKVTILTDIHAKLSLLLQLLLSQTKDMSQIVNVLQALYQLSVREFPKEKKSNTDLQQEGLAPQGQATDAGSLFENAVELPEDPDFYRHLRRVNTILTSRDSMHNVPVNLEARRRIAFFSNSLFMNMPRAPNVEKMMAFTVLTPYYKEDVLYAEGGLRKENKDGISTLFYLQKVYEDEWANFLERMRREGVSNVEDIWNLKATELRLWASYRGQTLSRTVRGMMYYYRALEMLSDLDSAPETDISTGRQKIASHHSLRSNASLNGPPSVHMPASPTLDRAPSGVSLLLTGRENKYALMKFTYVVTCQVYGLQKANKDQRANDILYLMKKNEALRVAYVDEVHSGRDEVEFYSVLVKYDQQLQREVEIYRIQLPGPVMLGEGKPENQNHAIIFTRGDALQTIDMNQDNYFEEALKMRNLLEEFKTYYGIRRPTILGVRENVFSGSVSSLAWFMSSQEMSFVTLGQRVLANPLKVRMHYGHPDVFDRFWFLTRGGISKASKVINISEDIFAGFNCTLRGGNVTHHEYIQVGKGRDVGLNQISKFEAKVASGNGEQVLSRDMYRLGHRLDFFRMLSVFYTTVGFYFNSLIVVLTIYTFLWGRLCLALSGIEGRAINDSVNNEALGAILNQQFAVQLGLLTALPMIVENSLEHGFLPAVWDFITMQLQLASFFYTFSLGTRVHYFGRTILHGGAKYQATGRGFVVEYKSFAENYRLYARSHLVKAIELGAILVLYASQTPMAKDAFFYIPMTISSWFLVVSWIMSPFIFNPSGFDWLKTVIDYNDFMKWIWNDGGMFTKADQSWETWWYEEQDHLRMTGRWGKLWEIILDLRFFLFQYGVVYQLGITRGNTSVVIYLLSWIYMGVAIAIYVIMAYARDKYAAKEHKYYRLIQLIVIVVVLLVIVVSLGCTHFEFLDLVKGLLAFVPTGWGLISIVRVLRPFSQSTVAWGTVVSLARLYDMLFGIIVMAPVALLSWLPGIQEMQIRILFNEAFRRGLQISRILRGRKSR
ncbi:hypothetical protein EUGRSUZ_D00622 [Eucalyptus grandis]|uniref:Uncharacterized protein n=2 Tax=Eucalyptus grandis TaxID=71139 RepID=A0ACC3L3Z4_EUCGR|nr:hypothetical protein EUGRSUZ_D00622 [Eucalyptus grandis]